MDLDEIYNKYDLSIRTYNICKDNDLLDIISIHNHYTKYDTFKNLRNCGVKSDYELKYLCKSFNSNIDYPVTTSSNSNEKHITEIIENLNLKQRQIINNYIQISINNLSNRKKNAISYYLDNNFKIKHFSSLIFEKSNFDANKLQNIGGSSIYDIKEFIENVKKFTYSVSTITDESELNRFNNSFYIQSSFNISNIPKEVIDANSIFTFTNFLFENNCIFEKKYTAVLKRTMLIFSTNSDFNFESNSSDLKLTRERIRQIRNVCYEKLFEKLSFLKYFEEDLFKKYNLDIENNNIRLSNEIVDNINRISNTNFSSHFIVYIIFVYLSDSFSLLGDPEDVLFLKQISNRNKHNWKNLYLVSSDQFKRFDFNKLIQDISYRLNEKIDTTYQFHFKSYLSNFLKIENLTLIKEVYSFSEYLINEEFNLYLDLNENIVFQKNTHKHLREYIEEAIEFIGKPVTVENIYDFLEKKYPGLSKSAEALRGSCQRSDKLIYFGRTSTYGLKIWEKERDNIKGGTIKDIVTEYLEINEEPIHAIELLNEIHKFREHTSTKNIISNLKLDPNKKYKIFNQSFVGLKSKSYKSSLTYLPKFLGKTMINYIESNNKCKKDDFTEYFSKKLNISIKNTNFILQSLLESGFITLTNNNELIHENTRN